MNNNNDMRETRRRRVGNGQEDITDSTVPNGDFTRDNVAPQKFPCAWTCSVMSSCLFLTVVLMPLLALNLPTAPRDDLPWWQKSVVYRIKTREFHDSDGDGVGDIEGVTKSAEYLQWLGVAAIQLDPIFPRTEDGITSYYETDKKLGKTANVKDMVDAMHKNGIRVILDLEINHSHQSHPWFKSSQQSDPKYKDYYVWHNGKVERGGRPQPPNNWLSVSGGSAWSFDETRQQYFLHQFHSSLPDLNFHNPAVVGEVENMMKFWLDTGVDGFHISHVDYLIEIPEVSLHEPRSCNHDALPTDYSYLLHPHTHQVSFVHNLTKQWRNVLDEHQDANRPLLLLLDSWPSAEGGDFKTWSEHNQGRTQLAVNYALSGTFNFPTPCGGSCLGRHVAEIRDLGVVDALFTWTTLMNRSRSLDITKYAEVYNTLVSMLPGTPIIQAGEETAFCQRRTFKSIEEHKQCSEQFKNLLELRQEPAFLWGRLEDAIENENIFSFFRYAKGWHYTKFLVTVNVGSQKSRDNYVNSSPMVKCPEQGTIAAFSSSTKERTELYHRGHRVFLNNLELYPGEGFVIALR